MNIIMTKFVYPIEKKIKIMDGYYFDNPRTVDEIKYIANIIKKSAPFPPNDRLVKCTDCVTLEYMIEKFKGMYSNEDNYVSEFIENSKYKDTCYKLASMWVVLRIELETKNYYKNLEIAQNYIDTITLLSFDVYNYSDFSILIYDEYFELESEEMCNRVQNAILEIIVEVTNKKCRDKKKEEYRFNGFTFYYNNILEICNKMVKFENKELITYVMESIQCLRKNYDIKMKFVSIISIIELLLTHSPDSNRYNIEDSISKQFKNKIALILYMNNNSIEYEKIIKECALMYSLRSDISHGNFVKLDEDLKKYFRLYIQNNDGVKENYDKVYTIDKLISKSLNYMAIVLKEYLNDSRMLDIVKKI